MFRIIPREDKFFDFFKHSGDLIVKSAHEFQTMLGDLEQSELYRNRIKEFESQADEITHQTVALLHTTFITPLDRDVIHGLITRMDDILDFFEAAAERIHLYELKNVRSESLRIAEICVDSAVLVKKAVDRLDNLKRPKELLEICVEINRLENAADLALRTGIARLFHEESDTRELIKHKEIMELMETVTDRCEDVANTIEGIVLEYA